MTSPAGQGDWEVDLVSVSVFISPGGWLYPEVDDAPGATWSDLMARIDVFVGEGAQ
jgi:hypothetical protein